MSRITATERAALDAVDPALLRGLADQPIAGLRRLDDRVWAVTTLRPFRTWIVASTVASVPVGLAAAFLADDGGWAWIVVVYGVLLGMLGGAIQARRFRKYTLPMLGAITDLERLPPFLEAVLRHLAELDRPDGPQ